MPWRDAEPETMAIDEMQHNDDDSVENQWLEVPIAYDDDETPCFRITPTDISPTERPTAPPIYPVVDRVLRDSASVSNLAFATLTSSASVEIPSVVTIYLLAPDKEPRSVALDLGDVSGFVYAAKVAAVDYQGGIRLVLVLQDRAMP